MAVSVQEKNYPRYSLFLDERQQMLAKQALNQYRDCHYCFGGGYEGAKRQMLCVYPDYLAEDSLAFPFRYLYFTFRKSDALTHRDFLGSLMALRLKRETIGDIVVGEGEAAVVAGETAAEYILQNMQKIGRVGVSVSETDHIPLRVEQQFAEIAGTVASLRIDCVVGLATKLSRSKTMDLVSAGRVQLNYEEVSSPSILLKPEDIITVRGFGKYILAKEIRETKKGRYHILLQKYI